jgi:hypothetical protein
VHLFAVFLIALAAHAQPPLKKGKPMDAPTFSPPWIQVETRDFGIQSFRCELNERGYKLHYSGDMGSRTFTGEWASGEFEKMKAEFKALEIHLRDETDADRRELGLTLQGKAKAASPQGEALYRDFIKNSVAFCRKKAKF